MRKAHLFNQENKMKLINQQLYKRRKIAFKKLRIQQQQQQQPINININTGFEANRRIKEIDKRLELLTPQERTPEPTGPMGETTEEMVDIERMDESEERMRANEEEAAERVRADNERDRIADLVVEKLNTEKEAKEESDIAIAEEERLAKIEQDEEKAKQLTPRDLRLNAALVRQEERRKEKREKINSLFM